MKPTPRIMPRCSPAIRAAVGDRHRLRHGRRHPDPISSNPSSPPRKWAKAPAWGCPRSTASSGRAAATSGFTASPARGTTFKIYLPRVAAEAESALPGRVPEATPQGHETILLVEDDDGVRQIAGRILRRSGYQVLEAREGDQALQICRRVPGCHSPGVDRPGNARDQRSRFGCSAWPPSVRGSRWLLCPDMPKTMFLTKMG